MEVRRGSNERDSSSSTEWSSPVMLSATDPSLRGGVTRCDCSNGQGLFFTLNLALEKKTRVSCFNANVHRTIAPVGHRSLDRDQPGMVFRVSRQGEEPDPGRTGR